MNLFFTFKGKEDDKLSFECNYCPPGKIFSASKGHRWQLQGHLKRLHSSKVDQFNELCKQYSITNDNFFHFDNDDDDDDEEEQPIIRKFKKKRQCDWCAFSGKTNVELATHVKTDHMTCTKCKKKFPSVFAVEKHMFKVHKIGKVPVGNNQCNICGETFQWGLRRHERLKHGIVNEGKWKFKTKKPINVHCPKCEMSFDSATSLNRHAIDCLKEGKDFQCTACDSKWSAGKILNIHMLIDHHYPRMFTCDICGLCQRIK